MRKTNALKALETKVSRLARQLGTIEDTNAVRRLHFIYGYYIDMCLYDEAVALFAHDGAARFLNGLYKGKAGVKRLYCDWFRQTFTKGRNGPVFGFLLDHLQMQDVVSIAPDRKSARARFRALNMIGYHDAKPEPLPHMPPFAKTYPENPLGPDEILAEQAYSWPETRVVPFHYPHPVTGEPWEATS